MNAYQKTQQLNLAGTPQQIVDVLKTLTVSDIPTASVRTWFREKELWLERSTGGMFGPLQAAYEAASQPQKDGLDYLYDTVFAGSAQWLRTTQPVWAVKVWQLVQLVVALSPQASGLIDSFYALDGGRPFAALTVEQYEEQQVAAEEYAVKDGLRTRVQFEKTQFDSRVNEALAAIDAGTVTTGAGILTMLRIAEG
jgi:hypothetical protein